MKCETHFFFIFVGWVGVGVGAGAGVLRVGGPDVTLVEFWQEISPASSNALHPRQSAGGCYKG